MIFGPVTSSEEEIVPTTTTAQQITPTAVLAPAMSSFAPTAMGMTNIVIGVGSLPYQDPMEYVNDEEQHEQNCLNNGINAVEIIFANTPAQQAKNSVIGTHSEEEIFNQILSNTSKHCSQQQQRIKQENLAGSQHLSDDYYHQHNNNTSAATHNIQPHQIASCSQQQQLLQPNLSSSSARMYFDDIHNFLSDYDLCEEKDSKLERDLQHEGTMSLGKHCNGDNDAMDNDMDLEETFEITHENDGMILTSTQELIIANGISTEDFAAFHEDKVLFDNQGEYLEMNFTDAIAETEARFKPEIKLEMDPMLSVDILGGGASTPSPTSPDNKYNIPDNLDIGEKAAQQLLDLIEYAESGPKKTSKTNTTGLSLRKNKGQNLNLNIFKGNAPDKVDLTTAQVVDTVFTWETANTSKDHLPSPLDRSSLPPSSSNSLTNDHTSSAFLYDDVTQTSHQSDSRFDFSGFASTAPPTPFSTASYETSNAAERKRRGRPPKTHSTQPDPEKLEKLPASQRKYLMQRYKNNEASRQSRRNRKNKQDKQKEEEAVEQDRNDYLHQQVAKWENAEMKLKEMLRQLVLVTN